MTKKTKRYQIEKVIVSMGIGEAAQDKAVVESVVEGKTIIEYADGKAKQEINKVWEKLQAEVEKY